MRGVILNSGRDNKRRVSSKQKRENRFGFPFLIKSDVDLIAQALAGGRKSGQPRAQQEKRARLGNPWNFS